MILAENRIKRFFIAGGIILYLVFLLFYVNISYPWVGHDFRYFLPRLLDTYIHSLNNGLSIQWFTPSFGGGLPAFPNPQQIQFSLTQFLVFMFNPWIANLISIAVYTLIGYFACYFFGRNILQFSWMVSVLCALFFVGSGFIIQHLASGHINFHVYPLSALFFYVLFSQAWKVWQRGVVLGMLLAIFIHAAGFYIVIVLVLSFFMVVPLVYLLQPNWRDIKGLTIAVVICVLSAVLLSGGKMYAVLGFMQNFPRVITDHYYSSFIQSLVGFVMQLIGVPLFTIPFRVLKDDPSAVGQMMTALIGGSRFGLWEMDVAISPVLLYIFFLQFRKIPRKLRDIYRQKKIPVLQKDQVFALMVLVFGVWLAFEFTSARGVLFDPIRTLPIVRSLYNNLRYAVSYLIPMVFLGGYFFNKEFSQVKKEKRIPTFSFFYLVTLLWLGVYFLLPYDLQSRNFNLQQTLSDYTSVKNGGTFQVSGIMDITDNLVFSNQASSLHPYENIFGYGQEEFLTQLVPGSIFLEESGFYNLTNPRSLVYDTDELFARFTIDQRETMEQFAQYQQPDWSIPRIQLVLNGISGATFWAILGYGVYLLVRRLFLSSGRRF